MTEPTTERVSEVLLPAVSLGQFVAEEIRANRVEIPVLPEVALRVQEVVANEGELAEIASIIEREPAFAAAILRYANSVAFAGLRQITDLRSAVTRLGTSAVEQTVLAVAAKGAFVAPDPEYDRLFRTIWRHSVTAAIAARRLATRNPGVQPELAFLGGLLHDVGKIVILRCAATLRKRDPRYALPEGALIEFFDSLHCTAGEALFDAWRLPTEIRDAVRHHHDAKFEGPNLLLTAIVSFSDRIAAKLGSSLAPDPDLSLHAIPAASHLRLDDLKLAALLVDVEDDVQTLRDQF